MAAFMTSNVEIRQIDLSKGKGLFATKDFKKGDVLFEERPIVSSQFLWNEFYNYTACEYCLKSLETAETQCQRLTENPSLSLPFPECCEAQPAQYVMCPQCQVVYCCDGCRTAAWTEYHRTLCMGPSRHDGHHPLAQLGETWRNIHFPPETSSIMLLAKMIAIVKQSDDGISKFSQFVNLPVNKEEEIAHKLLGEDFKQPLELLRQMVTECLFEETIQQWYTPEGFRSLFALIGMNGQGIGSSAISVWVKNCEKLQLSDEDKQRLDGLIDQMYEDLDRVSGTFLNCEGSGLYRLQSACNHSCLPNAEITFPHNNHCLALVATEDIQTEEEICISYLNECNIGRSRHSRQKILRENYLFHCGCTRCAAEADDEDVTSEEEEYDEEDEGMTE
ncbi:histone-lysine N-trimethyltransferase SMYD5-like [Ylistrum balloti]|uniref:histone-lysine N-trimethyltransferase SMYD5-like n=1 Tax=Ylistrum balloti TaxID=509963 RepID=UPI002905BF93|nr:histone-lysine N-trimethyltransferase SMYD5-like [Ylistrum balloti]